jgi:hypothetical protein
LFAEIDTDAFGIVDKKEVLFKKKEGDKNMAMFDRGKDELIPLLYNVGDRVMGHENSLGIDMLVGGIVIDVKQSTSYLESNSYNVKLEPEVCTGVACKGTWWIDDKNVIPFEQDVWNMAVKHWREHLDLKEKSYMEYVRMFRTLREENDEIGDKELREEIGRKQ